MYMPCCSDCSACRGRCTRHPPSASSRKTSVSNSIPFCTAGLSLSSTARRRRWATSAPRSSSPPEAAPIQDFKQTGHKQENVRDERRSRTPPVHHRHRRRPAEDGRRYGLRRSPADGLLSGALHEQGRKRCACPAGRTIVHRHAQAGGGEPAFWSYQSGSYRNRPDWVLPAEGRTSSRTTFSE